MVRAIAERTPTLLFKDGHEAVERLGAKRTTRRVLTLKLLETS
jgi:hypothetical protein